MTNRRAGHGLKVTRVSNAVAAGTTDSNGTGLSMAGFDGVMFIAALGTITATGVQGLKAQQSDDDGATDTYGDLTGTLVSAADDDDNKLVILDIFQPGKLWVRPVVTRATANCVIDGVIAIQYGAANRPTTHDAATVVGIELHDAPAEGTA